jgi:hypothetical protein
MGNECGEERDNGGGGKEALTMSVRRRIPAGRALKAETRIARSQRVRPLAGPMMNFETKQSSMLMRLWIASLSLSSGRRSRTRWIAMTTQQ